ncbi:MAG TPA: TonB-dependent receptor [bacterium]
MVDEIKLFVVAAVVLSAGRISAQMVADSSDAPVLPPVERKISVQFSHQLLRDALLEIAQKSQVKFVYSDELLKLDYRVSAKLQDKTPPEILEKILVNLPLGFVAQSQSQIVLTKKTTIIERYGSLQGQVLDVATGEALSGANVEVLGTTYGVASNFGGFFTVRLPAGAYTLRVSVIGYEATTRQPIQVVARKKTYLTFRLQPTVLQMQEVQVTSSRTNLPEHMEIEPSVIAVRRSQFTATPTVGEPDLFRTLQNLPGVSSPNDYSSELFIRGGSSDQNLILLDGAVVYNPYHLLGLAGAFNPDIVEQVNLSLGGFSARYGDRLSSVIDVRTKSTTGGGTGGFGNFSLMSSKLTVLGNPHPRLNWMISGRRTYHDVAASLFVGKDVPYYFYDFYGKLVFNPGKNNLLYFSSFYSRDQFSYTDKTRHPNIEDWFDIPPDSPLIPDDEGYTSRQREFFFWNNLILTAHWLHDFGANGQFELQFSQSRSPSDLDFEDSFIAASDASEETRRYVDLENQEARERNNLEIDNSLLDRSLKADWTIALAQSHRLSLGGGLSFIRLRYFWKDLLNEINQKELALFFDTIPDNFNYLRNLRQFYFYVEDSWNVTRRLSARPGIRFEKRSFNGSWAIEPRFNLSYQWNDALTFKAAYGLFHQGLGTSLERGYIQFLPLPFPSENAAPLERSHHVIAGSEWRGKKWEFSLEAYYKSLGGLLKTINGTPEFTHGTGRAYGVELSARKLGDRFNLEVNYALSYARRNFDAVEYYTSFDQRHNFSALGQYHLGKNWLLNFRWTLATGRPFTAEDVFFRSRYFDPSTGQWILYPGYDQNEADLSQQKNRFRYPVYHRLDVSFSKRIQKHGWALLPYIQVVNAYYRRNVLTYDWDYDDSGRLKRTILPMMPIIPTFGLALEF